MSDEHQCEMCGHWQSPVRHWTRWCVVLRHYTGPADRCDHYCEADVPLTDDVTGSDAELDALVRGE